MLCEKCEYAKVCRYKENYIKYLDHIKFASFNFLNAYKEMEHVIEIGKVENKCKYFEEANKNV